MIELWKKWEPIKGLSRKYYFDEVLDTIDGGFNIILSDAFDKRSKLTVSFESTADGYRKVDERFGQHMISELRDHYGAEFYTEWSFFKIENSQYIKWLSEQSCGISDYMEFTHFCFITVNAVLDIIDRCEPTLQIEVKTENNDK